MTPQRLTYLSLAYVVCFLMVHNAIASLFGIQEPVFIVLAYFLG